MKWLIGVFATMFLAGTVYVRLDRPSTPLARPWLGWAAAVLMASVWVVLFVVLMFSI